MCLVTRRALNTHIKEDGLDQRENLFQTRCFVQSVPCSVVIDSGSCSNVVSSILVKRLNLKTQLHPLPYKLQWLNDHGEVRVINKLLFLLLLENMLMMFYVILYPCMLEIYYWGGLGNLIVG